MCVCGYAPGGKANESACSTDCPGDSTYKCGGIIMRENYCYESSNDTYYDCEQSFISVYGTGRQLTPIDGEWSHWSYTNCTNGQYTRSRTCDYPSPFAGGADCTGDSEETLSCSLPPFDIPCTGELGKTKTKSMYDRIKSYSKHCNCWVP